LLRDLIADRTHRIAIEHAKLLPDSKAIAHDQEEKNQCCDRLYALTPFMDEEISAIIRQYAPLTNISILTATNQCAATLVPDRRAREDRRANEDRRARQDRRASMPDRRASERRQILPTWAMSGQA
jgi:hypothetical protein